MADEQPGVHTNRSGTPTISFCFDDGYLDNYAFAFPVFRKHNMTATSFIIVGKVGDYFESQRLMEWKHLEAMQAAGWEIGSHSLTHSMLTQLSPSGIEKELRESSEILREHGMTAEVFAVPYGNFNVAVRGVVEKYYKAMRTSIWGFNIPGEIDQYELKAVWTVNRTSIHDVKSWIDKLQKDRSWLIILMHHVEKRKRLEYTISDADLERLLKYVEEKKIKVKTLSDALSENRASPG